MKKVAIIMALLLIQTQLTVTAATNANYNKKPAQQSQVKNVNAQKTQSQKEDNYLLKYNINDLEAAPWLNNGKRKI